MGKAIAIINRKGGSAKTTTAVNLAGRLAQRLAEQNPEERVLLIDLDPQGHAARALGVDTGDRCISYFLLEQRGFKETIVPADRAKDGGPNRPNLFVFPSTDRLQRARIELQIRSFSFREFSMDTVLRDRFGRFIDLFKYVIVDCPPSLDVLARATYDLVDEVIVPVKMAYLDTAGARQHLDDILGAQESGIDVKISYVLPTFYRSREILARQVLGRLREIYGRRLASPIPQSVIIEKSQAAGQQTLFEYAPESKPALAYDQLAMGVMNGDG